MKWNRWRRLGLRLLALAGAHALLVGLSGCTAADRATDAISDVIKTSATTMLEKANFTQTAASVNGRIQDPVYRVSAKYVQGVEVEVGVRGVEVSGNLSAQGAGADKPLSPETIAALRAKGLSDDTIEVINELLRKAGEKVIEKAE